MNKITTRLKAVFLALSISALLLAASPPPQGQGEQLSPYWGHGILQWEELILAHARQENLDPDFLSSVVWRESFGLVDASSYMGAVGLMQVMPVEEGYAGRPTREELLDPDLNMRVGTEILVYAINMADGDIFRALTLYNGGSTFENTNEARGYAQDVITLYMQAVAMHHGYSYEEVTSWGLIFEIQGRYGANIASSPVPGWLVTSHLPSPQPTPGRPAIRTTVYSAVDEYGQPWRVNMWLLPN
jgi:hypothetical protein